MNPTAWPASPLVLVSSAFTSGALPEVLLGSVALAVSRQDDSTLTALLPDTAGTFALTVQWPEIARHGSVTVAGHTGHQLMPPLQGWPLPVEPGSPVLIAAGESTLMRVNLLSASVSALPIEHRGYCSYSVGSSYRDMAVVAAPWAAAYTCRSAQVWNMAVPPTVVDSGPAGGSYFHAELSPGTWFVSAHHWYWISQGGVLGPTIWGLEEGERVVFSPDRSRVVALAGGTSNLVPPGIPVLNAADGSVAYSLPMIWSYAAAFSPEGDTLFALGGGLTSYTTTHLLAVNAASGAVLLDVPNDAGSPSDLLLDPDGPRIYAVNFDGAVDVFDRTSLLPIAHMKAPPCLESESWATCGYGFVLAIDPAAHRLFVFTWPTLTDVPTWGNSAVVEYVLPPATQPPVLLEQ